MQELVYIGSSGQAPRRFDICVIHEPTLWSYGDQPMDEQPLEDVHQPMEPAGRGMRWILKPSSVIFDLRTALIFGCSRATLVDTPAACPHTGRLPTYWVSKQAV
jgi:hypothetical protein